MTKARPNPDVMREAQIDGVAEMKLDTRMRRAFAKLPDPAAYAHGLPPQHRHALRQTIGMRASTHTAGLLRPYGLVDFASPNLTAFGMAVRKALQAESGQ
jgi:hypothetical protein